MPDFEPSCTFCRIITGQLPSSIVYRDEHTLAFLDIQPVMPGHALVVPVRHAASLATLPEEDGAVSSSPHNGACR